MINETPKLKRCSMMTLNYGKQLKYLRQRKIRYYRYSVHAELSTLPTKLKSLLTTSRGFRPNPPVDTNHEKFTDVINKQVHMEYRNIINIQETTTEELRIIIETFGGRKARGHDGVTNTAIKYLTLEAVDMLKEITNATIRHQNYPKTWKHTTIIILHKSGKPKKKAY
ncbi:hypothetical protein Trydic_g19090 [Trypoxylus dichotomus]